MITFPAIFSKRRIAGGEPITWTSRVADGGTEDLQGITYDGTYWVVDGGDSDSGILYYANDVTSWSSRVNIPYTVYQYASAYDGTYVAIATKNGLVYHATDITDSWTQNSVWGSGVAYGLDYDGSTYWVCGGYSTGPVAALYYTDDVTGSWTSVTSGFTGSQYIHELRYLNGYWIAVGTDSTISYTTDPTSSWTAVANPFAGTIYSIAYGSGYWVAVGTGGEIAYTSDPTGVGEAWTLKTNPFGTTDLTCVEYGNGAWAAGGIGGILGTCPGAPTNTWTLRTSNTATSLKEIRYLNGYWIACGYAKSIITAQSGA